MKKIIIYSMTLFPLIGLGQIKYIEIIDNEKLEARYGNLLPVMVKAIQEQQLMIESLKKEIQELKKK